MLKPGGWVLFEDLRVTKSIEGALGVLQAFEALKKVADDNGRDLDIGLQFVPILSKYCDKVNVHCVDIQLNPISPGMS